MPGRFNKNIFCCIKIPCGSATGYFYLLIKEKTLSDHNNDIIILGAGLTALSGAVALLCLRPAGRRVLGPAALAGTVARS